MMTREEYEGWSSFMKASKGHWTIDPIHNGELRDLIVFRPSHLDESCGLYISVYGSTIVAGRFAQAIPHLTDGIFEPVWGISFLTGEPTPSPSSRPTREAVAFVAERVGIDFLLALTHGRSPYRRM